MQIGKRDIEKMVDYHSKGSRPEILARTVKDLDKAKSRAVIAAAMGWYGCSREFIKRCRELGATDEDIAEVDQMCDTYELPEQYKSQLDGGPKLKDVSLLREWFPKLFKVLRDHKVTNLKLESRHPTSDELEKDRMNGRCWTVAYTVSFDYNGKHYDWKIANHSNEGGGSYGVSAQKPLYVYQGTQQELADRAAAILDREMGEGKSSSNGISGVRESDFSEMATWRVIHNEPKYGEVVFNATDSEYLARNEWFDAAKIATLVGNLKGARLEKYNYDTGEYDIVAKVGDISDKAVSEGKTVVKSILAGKSVRQAIMESLQ